MSKRAYVQQIKNEEPLRFGIDTLPEMEFDYVDQQFPATILRYRFARSI
jgi:hypothetical protein